VTALGLAVAVTWPLAAELNTATFASYDLPVQAWAIDWVHHALLTDATLLDANIFTPAPDALTFSDALLGVAGPALVLRPLGVEAIGAVNLALIGGVAANAVAAYWLGRLLTGRVLAGAVCGATYAFAPYSLVTTTHVHTAVRPGLPVLVGLIWLVAERWRARNGAGGGAVPRVWPLLALVAVTVAWQGSISFYAAAFCGVVVVVAVAVRFSSLRWGGLRSVAAAAIAGSVPIVLIAVPYLANQRRYGDYRFSLVGVTQLRTSGRSFVTTDAANLLWGDWLGVDGSFGLYLRRLPLFPGFLVVALAAVGLVALRRTRVRREREAWRLGIALTLTGGLLSLGASNQKYRQFSPFRILTELVPGWRSIRAADRFWVVAVLGLGVLAGLGAIRTVDRLAARAAARTDGGGATPGGAPPAPPTRPGARNSGRPCRAWPPWPSSPGWWSRATGRRP
jgi:hypothetical protein